MEQYYTLLKSKMDDALLAIGLPENIQVYAKNAIGIISETISTLKDHLLHNSFASPADEIMFFKHIAPEFYSLLIYYNKLYHIEANRASANLEFQKKYLRREYKKLSYFYCANIELFSYYATGSTGRDADLFVSEKPVTAQTQDDYAFWVDTRVCPLATYKISKLKACKELETYILNALHDLKTNNPATLNIPTNLQFTAGKPVAVEMIYLWFVAGVFNNGNAKLKEIAAAAGQWFKTDLSAFHRIYYDIKMRKKERLSFFKKAISRLEEKMDAEEA